MRAIMDTRRRLAFDREIALSEQLVAAGDLARAFSHLERAHVIGQTSVSAHSQAHWRMLKLELRRRRPGAVLGQVARLILGAIGSAVGVVPVGNTGGANVSAFKPMPIPDDLAELIGIDEPAARLNALLSGQIDMMSQLDPRQARAYLNGNRIRVLNAPSTTIQVFSMAVDLAPFRDKRVRQAFRLIADRQALINGALAGFATPGNDLPGRGLPNWLAAPVRKRDPERAKFLLKQAGQEDLGVTLQTSNVVPGFVEAATLFAQQAKAAGVDVKVKKESATAYFDTSLLYTKMAFAQSFWTISSLGTWYTQALLSDAIWNETHWRQKSYDKLIQSAIGAPTAALARKRWREVQEIQYTDGGYIVWANINLVGVGDYPRQAVRWGGNFGSAFLYFMVPRVILFREEHSPRTLVRRVDFVSAPGTSAPAVFRPGGPAALVTPLCLFAFDKAAGRFRLASVHPGRTAAEVQAATGFDYDVPASVPETEPPAAEWLALLRGRVAGEIADPYPKFAARVFGVGAAA